MSIESYNPASEYYDEEILRKPYRSVWDAPSDFATTLDQLCRRMFDEAIHDNFSQYPRWPESRVISTNHPAPQPFVTLETPGPCVEPPSPILKPTRLKSIDEQKEPARIALPKIVTQKEQSSEQQNIAFQYTAAACRVAKRNGFPNEVINRALLSLTLSHQDSIQKMGTEYIENDKGHNLDLNSFNRALQRHYWLFLHSQQNPITAAQFNALYAPTKPIADNIKPNPARDDLPKLPTCEELTTIYLKDGEAGLVNAARTAGIDDAILIDFYLAEARAEKDAIFSQGLDQALNRGLNRHPSGQAFAQLQQDKNALAKHQAGSFLSGVKHHYALYYRSLEIPFNFYACSEGWKELRK